MNTRKILGIILTLMSVGIVIWIVTERLMLGEGCEKEIINTLETIDLFNTFSSLAFWVSVFVLGQYFLILKEKKKN